MHTKLSAKFFAQNRQTLRARLGNTPIVIAGNGLLQRTSDTAYPFAQDSSFWYLTGCELPNSTLVMTADEEWLIVPERSAVRSAFDGAVDEAVLREQTGVERVLPANEGWRRLVALQPPKLACTYPAPPFNHSHELFTNPFRRQVYTQLKRRIPGVTLLDIRSQLAALRCIKQPEELACLEEAIAITKDAIEALTCATAFKTMRYEHEIEATLAYEFRRRGAAGHAFAPIIASGRHATTLHYVANNGDIADTDLIVLDVGAEISHYAADISRTVCQTTPNERQQAVYDAVSRVQKRALLLLRPGADYRAYEETVTDYIGEELLALGLIKSGYKPADIRYYYPHASSHFLGLDVHDVGDYRAPLAPGMVLTCEPGIYIPEEGIGVRIEDDVLITETGNRVL